MDTTCVGEIVAQHPREDGNFHSPQHMREHSPELRVSDIPAETMTVISDCQVPLMLVGITWPYDLIKSPLLYANTAMLNLIGGNSEADHLAGFRLARCSGSKVPNPAVRAKRNHIRPAGCPGPID